MNNSIFKTLDEILKNSWVDQQIQVELDPSKLAPPPDRQHGVYMFDLTLKDIRMWETLYYKGGHVGIYGAWDPYSEFFIIVYNLFLDSSAGLEVFYGPGAIRRLYLKAKELGINLETGPIWVKPEDVQYYTQDHLN
jgi:hypothetical protein